MLPSIHITRQYESTLQLDIKLMSHNLERIQDYEYTHGDSLFYSISFLLGRRYTSQQVHAEAIEKLKLATNKYFTLKVLC